MNLETNRTNYQRDELNESSIGDDPIVVLRAWLDIAAAQAVPEPNAMCLSTVGADGQPSSRIVLLRGLDDRGLRFFTSYGSRKGRDIAHNKHVAVTFYWNALERQVRVEGVASLLTEAESDAYFASRPRGHQLGAWASEQSESIEERAMLQERKQHFNERFEGEEVPRPHSWGGYCIEPDRIEFWQGRPDRLHDRLVFSRDADAWHRERLQP
ncbi:MAG TPA: pyridoxamine 5'-phosphate oxidase [Verrucomicrobiae bacterium]|nr:pyridoxamine 5'-phosphate oxidase [Verrucomicrobiae bacterium]